MKIVSWNVRRADEVSPVWEMLRELDADIVLLQEVGQFSEEFKNGYSIYSAVPVKPSGQPQTFSSAIATKGHIGKPLDLESEFDWVNRERSVFSGNIIACPVSFHDDRIWNVVSVYSPAWPVNSDRLVGIDVSSVKLVQNPDVWCTEILWSVLKNTIPKLHGLWLVGGDFNSSETFDYMWGPKPRGNKEVRERLETLGLKECLRYHAGELVPTFRNPANKKVVHQLDHLYVSNEMITDLLACHVGDSKEVFGNSLSDHLPIVCCFK